MPRNQPEPRGPLKLSDEDISLFLSLLAVLQAFGLGTAALVAAGAFLLGRLSR